MLRKRLLRKIYYVTLIIFITFVISSFNFNDNLPNIKTEYKNKISNIYLMNNDNYLVMTSILVKDNINDNIKIVIDNLKNSNHYSGLKGIIPNNTKINKMEINNKILNIDFNSELLNVNEELEEKVIECLVYSLLEFREIDGIKISINNDKLKVLPQSKIILDDILDKDFGINKEYNINKLNDTVKVVLYYYDTIDNNNYYVPVTKYMNSTDDKIKIIIDNLKNNYLYQTNLMSYLNEKVKINNYEYHDNFVMINLDDSVLEEEVIYTISNSIMDSININEVIFMHDNHIINVKMRNK